MATKTKQKETSSVKNILKVVHSENQTLKSYQSGRIYDIPLDQIDYSPFNDREYSEDVLQLFAKEIDRNEVKVPIMVRPINGRLELVYGERRTRASIIAGRETIPGFIKKGLSDEEVMFIQILENFEREDPHPMDLAKSFNRLKKDRGFSEKEIAARLGRSKSFVISRLKLMLLTEDWQRIYRLNKISTFEAFEVASLIPESQNELFQILCKNWRDKHFQLQNLDHYIARFKYDLTRAPFDIKDKNLYAAAGACIGCQHNSATFKTLFPDYAKGGFCSKKECFQTKCTNHLSMHLKNAIQEEVPEALIFNGTPNEHYLNIIQEVEGTSELQQFDQAAITILDEPVEPSKEDYTYKYYGNKEPEFNESYYNRALEDYYEELEEYNKQKENARKGLVVQGATVKSVLFLPERKIDSSSPDKKVTAKAVALAIKNGTVTKELLEAEKERIINKAKRDLELDEEKIMEAIYKQFEEKVSKDELNCTMTDADRAAMAYLIFLQIGYWEKSKIEQLVFADNSNEDKSDREVFYQLFNQIDNQKLCLMARKVLLGKSECKQPSNPLSQFLYKMAKEAGIDVEAIEKQQQQKAEERQERQKQRLLDIDLKIEKLDNKPQVQEDPEAKVSEDPEQETTEDETQAEEVLEVQAAQIEETQASEQPEPEVSEQPAEDLDTQASGVLEPKAVQIEGTQTPGEQEPQQAAA